MPERRPSLVLPGAFALLGLLFGAIGIASEGQQPPPRKIDASDTSCMYDPENGDIADCIQQRANGELFIKQKVLKQLHFDSYGLAPVFSKTYRWMYVSRTGRVLITGVPVMDNWADTFHDGLVRVVQNGKYGFSNRKGQLVVSPVYDGAVNFENGKAKVCNGCTVKCVAPDCEYSVFSGGEWFQIDSKGTVVSRIPAENEPKLIR